MKRALGENQESRTVYGRGNYPADRLDAGTMDARRICSDPTANRFIHPHKSMNGMMVTTCAIGCPDASFMIQHNNPCIVHNACSQFEWQIGGPPNRSSTKV